MYHFFTALYWQTNISLTKIPTNISLTQVPTNISLTQVPTNISLTQVPTQPLHNKYKEQNMNFEGQAMGAWLQDLIPVYWSVSLWHYQILYHNLTDRSNSSSEVFISQTVATNTNITF
jgi:hypothetical protein